MVGVTRTSQGTASPANAEIWDFQPPKPCESTFPLDERPAGVLSHDDHRRWVRTGVGPGSHRFLHTTRWRMATALSPPCSVTRAEPASRQAPLPTAQVRSWG